jgi:uncharacterized protein YbjT (DUF2867 family)
MNVLVTGGHGTLGRLLTPRLQAAGHYVVVASRKERTTPEGTKSIVLDLSSGTLAEDTFDGIDAVVHTASNAGRSKTVDVTGTQLLIGVAERAGLDHFVYISIVGIDDHPFAYYRSKLEAERLITDGATPSTILRATQFHQFLDRIFGSFGPIIPVFNGFEWQVIDGGAVADRLVELIDAGPQGRVEDLGGPRSEPMHDMAHSWKEAAGSGKPIMPVPVFGKSAKAFRANIHHTPSRLVGTPTWDDYLATTYPR